MICELWGGGGGRVGAGFEILFALRLLLGFFCVPRSTLERSRRDLCDVLAPTTRDIDSGSLFGAILGPKWSKNGAKGGQKGAHGSKMEPKGAKREPKGSQREPKGSNWDPK